MNDLCWNKEFAMVQVDNDEELLRELIAIFKDSSTSDLAFILDKDQKGFMQGTSFQPEQLCQGLFIERINGQTIKGLCRKGHDPPLRKGRNGPPEVLIGRAVGQIMTGRLNLQSSWPFPRPL